MAPFSDETGLIRIKLRQKERHGILVIYEKNEEIMSIKDQYKRESEQLKMFLNEVGDMLTEQSGFVQRQSKFDGRDLIQVMTLGCLANSKASLNDFCEVSQGLGTSISSSGLHQRLTSEAVELLSQAFQLWIGQKQSPVLREVLCNFAAVHIVDSSRIILPPCLAADFPGGRNPATMKIQLAYEYRSGQIEAIEIEDGRTPDQSCTLPVQLSQAGDLVLFDLGYTNQHQFADLDAEEVYFLTRLHNQIGLYECETDTDTVDLLTYVNALPADVQMGERFLYVGQKAKVGVRVTYHRVAPQVAQERRRKAKQAAKKRGKTCSQRVLDRLDWVFFMTNAPAGWLTTEQISIVYRVRWQIEILFKVWKQEMDWGAMGHWRVARILTQFYGRCLAIVLCHRLLEKYQDELDWEISWQKAFRLLKRRCNKLITIVRRNFWGIFTFLRDLDQAFRRFARKDKRRKEPSTYVLLDTFRA